MNNDNLFDLIITVVFAMSTQLGGFGTKAQDFVIFFWLGEVETLTQFHIIAIHIRSEDFLLQDKKGKINNFTGEYITEISKLKNLQQYMTTFELYHRRFERMSQGYQLFTIFNTTIE